MNQSRLSVLYFDDEASCLDVFKRMFGDRYEIRTALTLKEARQALAEASFDVVISDYLMPETDGLTFLHEVAAANPANYRVMLTGALGLGNLIHELSAGSVHCFLGKPWNDEGIRTAFELAELCRAERINRNGGERVHS
jgi:DNA-binding NtrC family response regulator